MAVFRTTVKDVIRRTPDVKSFRFDDKGNRDFRPGQYMMVSLNVGGEEKEKPFSISSSPTEEGYLEMTKRITDSEFSRALDRLRKGSEVGIRMPYGNFIFEGEYPKVALLSGGIGITPFMSICSFARDKGLGSDILLLYGNRDSSNIIFKDEIDRMQETNPNFRVVYTLTDEDGCPSTWEGCRGLIDRNMIEREVPDMGDRVFFVCGPPGMVKYLVGVLKDDIGLPPDKVRIENFAGYR